VRNRKVNLPGHSLALLFLTLSITPTITRGDGQSTSEEAVESAQTTQQPMPGASTSVATFPMDGRQQ